MYENNLQLGTSWVYCFIDCMYDQFTWFLELIWPKSTISQQLVALSPQDRDNLLFVILGKSCKIEIYYEPIYKLNVETFENEMNKVGTFGYCYFLFPFIMSLFCTIVFRELKNFRNIRTYCVYQFNIYFKMPFVVLL